VKLLVVKTKVKWGAVVRPALQESLWQMGGLGWWQQEELKKELRC
jgi:hypothetical protein